MQNIGFQLCKSNLFLHVYHMRNVKIYFLVYVNDILIAQNNKDVVTDVITKLIHKFQIKNLGLISNFLGIQTIYYYKGIAHTQYNDALDIIHRVGMINYHPIANPLQQNQCYPPLTMKPMITLFITAN